MSDTGHSYWSASGFKAVMLCPGKKVMEQGLANLTNEYAAEGTAAHQVLTWALQADCDAADFIGTPIHLDSFGKPCDQVVAAFTFVVDEDMVEPVQVCIDLVRELCAGGGQLMVDQKVNYSKWLGVDRDQAWGTLDVAVIFDEEIVVLDYKHGRGVWVDAERNAQMSLYALGAVDLYGDVADFKRVRMLISQPRLTTKASEWDCTLEELERWGYGEARSAVNTCEVARLNVGASFDHAEMTWEQTFLRPQEAACKFCLAKATCPALRDAVTETVFASAPASVEEFADLTVPGREHVKPTDEAWLAAALDKADLIESWVKAIRAEVETRLLAGTTVPGYKIVQGKKGHRKWSNPSEAEATLKSMKLKQEEMYDFSLISPTSAEKLHKAKTIGPRQWPKLQGLITQSEGKAHVAPATDPREAIVVKPVADEFASADDAIA